MALPDFSPKSTMSKVILPSVGVLANITTSSLPFGIYVSPEYWSEGQINAFKAGAVEQVSYVYNRLGGDVLDIELVDTQVYAAYEEAILEYSYLINLHQSKNVLPYVLGQATGSFDNSGQLTGSAVPHDIALKFPKMNFVYAKNIGISTSGEVGLNGNEPIYSASIQMNPGTQDYDLQAIISASAATGNYDFSNALNGKRIAVRKVYYKTAAASWNFYGYFGGLNVVGNLSTYGQYADDSTFEIIPTWQNKLQAMAYEDAIKTRVSDFSYELKNNKLRIYPVPNQASAPNIWVEFSVPTDAWTNTGGDSVTASSTDGINNMNTIPFENLPYDKINSIGKQWIRRFCLALCKEMLGQIRSKFGSIPIPGDSVTLNGEALISESQGEQDKLREELKTLLAEMTYPKIGEDSAKMMEDASKTQAYIPNLIYVG
jgi:hypothetical protein